MRSERFFIETFGCQMNVHDSEKISGLLVHRGMTPVSTPEEADLFLLNTCSVREKAAQKVYSRLGQMKERKRKEDNFRIGVVGCVAQQEGERMLKRAPFLDLVVGTHLYHSLPDLLDELDSRDPDPDPSRRVRTRFLADSIPVEIEPVMRSSRFRAQITIMEGCNKRCTFCIVPFTRGKERNRPAAAILAEVRRAADLGFVEIVLLGQTVNSYRDPRRPRFRFAELLAQVARVDGIRRIRFTSPHPREFNDDAIALMAQEPRICSQVHLPVQSGSNPILKRMRRQYTRERYLEIVEKFRRWNPDFAFSTDVIVGFPGETEDDFQQTMRLLETVRYESMFSFKYSPRPYTDAEHWTDDQTDLDKTRRLMQLQRRQKEIQLELHRDRYLGREFEVLVEGPSRDGVNIFGRTATNKVVNFPGQDPPGSFVQVHITGIGANSLMGSRIGPETSH